MTIQRTSLPYYDAETNSVTQEFGYVINCVKDSMPMLITGTESKDELKQYLLKTISEIFDKSWNKYEQKRKVDNHIIYQFGMID